MFWKKCRTLVTLVLIAGVCGVGIGAGRGDQPSPAGGRKPTAEVPPPAEPQRPADGDLLRGKLVQADKLLDDADAKLAAERSTLRAQIIAVEEKLRELEHRQAWAREQQRRALQNLDTAQRDRQSQVKTLEAKLRERQIEIDQAAREAARAKELYEKKVVANSDIDKIMAHYEALRRTAENESSQVKQLQTDIAVGQKSIEMAAKDALASEEQRTAERVKLRRELADIEEHSQLLERRASRHRDRLAADVEALSAKLRQADGAPAAPPAGADLRELQRQLDALQREVNDLRREQKRAAKPE